MGLKWDRFATVWEPVLSHLPLKTGHIGFVNESLYYFVIASDSEAIQF